MSNKYSALLSNDVSIEIASPTDFKDKELRVLKQFDPVINGYFPYCYDPINYDLIYVHIKSTSEIMDQAFVWEYLRAQLTDAIKVPYPGRIDRVERILPFPTFIFSPGRSGSTLLYRLLRAMGLNGLSEPDYYSQACVDYAKRKTDNSLEHIRNVLKTLTMNCYRSLNFESTQPIVIKLRSQCCQSADLLLGLTPEASKTIFLIRNFAEYSLSRFMAFKSSLASSYNEYITALRCYEFLKANSDCLLIRYEDLISNPLDVSNAIFEHLDQPKCSVNFGFMSANSQEGTLLNSLTDRTFAQCTRSLHECVNFWENNKPSDLLNALELDFL